MRIFAAPRPAFAVLLAAAMVPATFLGQTANTPPTPPDQTAAPASQQPVPVTTTPAPAAPGETVVLSPFEVNAQQAQGYFTPNTTTGTRLANNIGDIPSSVTVIDRQQLENTNSQNINDIMMYEAGTQGSRTYTQATGFSESARIDDVLAGTNDTQTAIGGLNTNTTRINSLGLPDNEVDNFYGLYRIPFDTYNVQSIEIDRGPNSLMFGSGSAAGIVNASSNEAQIDKLSGDASFQGSSFGGFRETADINIPLVRNKVAVYLAQVYNSVGMQRQPSSDLTRRQYATITIDPFKSHKTKLTAYAEFYNNYARDENSLLPTDEVTPWLAAGRPIFNPVTQMITDLGTGKVLGPYVSSTTSPGYVAGYPTGTGGFGAYSTPLYQQGIGAASNHFTEIFGLNGQYLYGFNPQQTLGSNYGGLIPVQVPTSPLTASQAMVRSEFMTNSAGLPGPGPGTPGTPVFYVNGVEEGGYASWITPGIVDQGIYNAQTGPNYYGTDYTVSKARTYHMDFQQNIISSSKWGSLDLDIGFLRQEYHDSEVTPDNQHGNDDVYVDTNSFLLNGMPNAYAGSILFYDYQGDAFQQPENDQNWRGMLTYAIDLRDKLPKWLQFLGHHRFMAEASTHDDVKQDIRFRTVINGGDGSYTSELYQLNNQPVIPGNWNIDGEGTDPYRWQYFSAPGSHVMDQPPSLYGIPGFGSQPTSITATTYNYYTGQWVNSGLTVASPAFNGYQITENVQDQKTYYWQSFFWNDRIIGSLGLNDDVVKNRSGGTVFNAVINGVPTATTNNAGLVSYINGVENPALKYLVGPWNPTTIAGQYATGTSQLLLQSLGEIGGNTYSEGFVVRPFENWSFIDSAANNGNVIAGVLRTLGMTFNKADNFNPPAGTYTDLLGNPLGKPTGQEKDYGLEIATPDKKLYLRMTWFKSANQNNTSGVSQTLTTREVYIDQNDMRQWAADVVALESGENPTSTQFGNQSIYPLSTAEYATMAQLTGLNQNYLEGAGGNDVTGGYSNSEATNTYSAAGYDLEVTYNPLPNWTLKFTGSRQIGQLSAVDLQAKAYQAVRMPIWTTASAPAAYQTVYTNYLGNGSTATANFSTFWTGWGFGSDTSATGGPNGGPQTVSNYYNTVVTIPITVEEAAQGQDVPEETEYTWNFLTNYQFTSGVLKNLGVGGGLRWLSSTVEGYYGATQTSLLNGSYQVAVGDLSKPIYNPAQLHADAWISYGFKLPFDDGKIKCTVQLNCVDLTSNGYIQAIQYNLDGSPAVYRVFPPRQFSLTTRFSF